MQAYFDSPETIRNKIKEFKTATIGGLNKQDVMNYLSLLSEQQGVMIRLLRENNIPLFVDDGYEQEEQFMKPMGDGSDSLNLNQYLGFDNSSAISEMQAEIEALKAENEALKMQSYSNSSSKASITQSNVESDFDVKYGISNSNFNDSEKTALLESLEEKDRYIKELEDALQGNDILFDNPNAEKSADEISDAERQAYEEEILNLRNTIASLESKKDETVNLFDNSIQAMDNTEKEALEKEIEELKAQLEEVLSSKETSETVNLFDNSSSIDDSVRESYEKEIEDLKVKLEEALSSKESSETLTDFDSMLTNTTENTENTDSLGNVDLSDYNKEIEALKSEVEASNTTIGSLNETIDSLNLTINDLKSELTACHELLDEYAHLEPVVESNQELATLQESNASQTEEIERLKTTIEVLEIEVSKKEKEKSSLEMKLMDVNEKLFKFTNYKDEFGNEVILDPDMLSQKYKELLEVKNSLRVEKDEINAKLSILKEKESLIESNKHLVSEDFINNITKKEQEIDSLRKQMDKMLLVAQTTADETEKEALEKATKMIENAKASANSILTEAEMKKEELLNEATDTLVSAKEFKLSTEEEATQIKEEARVEAENMINEAQNRANAVLEEAEKEAQTAQDNAVKEVEEIMSKAEQKVAEMDSLIHSKQKEIDNMQTYYLKVKNDGLVRVKQLYNQLENIIYSDEIS